MKYTLYGNPVPLARPRLSHRFTYDPQKKLKIALGFALRAIHGTHPLLAGPLAVEMIFYMPIPKSKRRRRSSIAGEPHTKKSDIDNLIKLIGDIGTGIIWKDDAQIWHLMAKKIYDECPRTEITVDDHRNSP